MICLNCNQEKPKYSKGLCKSCYNTQYKQKHPVKIELCVDCGRPMKIFANHLCSGCYARMRRKIDPIFAERQRLNNKKQWEVTKTNLERYELSKERGRLKYANNKEKHKNAVRAYNKTEVGKEVKANSELKRRAAKFTTQTERVKRKKVLESSNYICAICHEPIDPTLKVPNLKAFTVDHIIPLSRGGSHTYENLQAAHFSCNSSKSARLPT